MAILEYFPVALAVLGLVLRFYQYAPANPAESPKVLTNTGASRNTAPAKAARVRQPWADSQLLA